MLAGHLRIAYQLGNNAILPSPQISKGNFENEKGLILQIQLLCDVSTSFDLRAGRKSHTIAADDCYRYHCQSSFASETNIIKSINPTKAKHNVFKRGTELRKM